MPHGLSHIIGKPDAIANLPWPAVIPPAWLSSVQLKERKIHAEYISKRAALARDLDFDSFEIEARKLEARWGEIQASHIAHAVDTHFEQAYEPPVVRIDISDDLRAAPEDKENNPINPPANKRPKTQQRRQNGPPSLHLSSTKESKSSPRVITPPCLPDRSPVQITIFHMAIEETNKRNRDKWIIKYEKGEDYKQAKKLAAARILHAIQHDQALALCPTQLPILDEAAYATRTIRSVSKLGVGSSLTGALMAFHGLRVHFFHTHNKMPPPDNNNEASFIHDYILSEQARGEEKANSGPRSAEITAQRQNIMLGELQDGWINDGSSTGRSALENIRFCSNNIKILDGILDTPEMRELTASRSHALNATPATPLIAHVVKLEMIATGLGPIQTHTPAIRAMAAGMCVVFPP